MCLNHHALCLVETWAWRLSLLIELVLLVRIAKLGVWLGLPCFCLYVGCDTLRTVALMVAVAVARAQRQMVYAYGWRLTEPLSIALMVMMGVEALTVLHRRRQDALLLGLAGVTAMLAPLIPILHNGSDRTLMAVGGVLFGSLAVALISAMVCLEVRNAHAIILAVFYLHYFVCSMAIVHGAVGDPRAGVVLVIGAVLCFAAWIACAGRIRRRFAWY